jgi:hypothetical protein
MWHVWLRREMHTGFWCRNLRGRDHLGDLDIDGSRILKLMLKIGLAGTGFV